MKIGHIMKILIVFGVIFSLLTPTSADKIAITLSDTSLDFGNVTADGSTYSLSGNIETDSTVNIDVYVKASGPLTDGIDNIALNNFRYMFVNNTDEFTSFSTYYVRVIQNWTKGPSGKDPPINIDYGLTVPAGTPVGNYTTTITYTAVAAYSPTPAAATNTNTVTNNLVDNSTGINLSETNSSDDNTNTVNSTSGTGNITSFIDILLKLF